MQNNSFEKNPQEMWNDTYATYVNPILRFIKHKMYSSFFAKQEISGVPVAAVVTVGILAGKLV